MKTSVLLLILGFSIALVCSGCDNEPAAFEDDAGNDIQAYEEPVAEDWDAGIEAYDDVGEPTQPAVQVETQRPTGAQTQTGRPQAGTPQTQPAGQSDSPPPPSGDR